MNNIILQDKVERFHSERKKNQDKFLGGMNFTYLSLIIIIWGLLIHYVWSINSNANIASHIQALESQKRNLSSEIQKLSASIAEIESLRNISSDENLRNMETIQNPEFAIIKDENLYAYRSVK